MKIATCNVRTLLKDEHVQELEEELKENNMKWDVIGLGKVRRKEDSFTTLQSGHLLYHSEANNGQAGVGFLLNKKWKDNITRVSHGSSRVAELVLSITYRYQLEIVQVYAPTTSHSDEEIDDIDIIIVKILEKQTHYTIVIGMACRFHIYSLHWRYLQLNWRYLQLNWRYLQLICRYLQFIWRYLQIG